MIGSGAVLQCRLLLLVLLLLPEEEEEEALRVLLFCRDDVAREELLQLVRALAVVLQVAHGVPQPLGQVGSRAAVGLVY